MQFRLATIAGATALATLAACSTSPRVEVNVPPQPAPVYSTTTVTPSVAVAPVGVEYGRITNIEYFSGGVSRSGPNVPGAILGAVAGALLGNQIGSGSGRAAATVLGGVAGAAIGNNIARNSAGATTVPGYRITMMTDQGFTRVFEVPATGDLTVGDRVRVDAGVIYRA